jgi:hypothetical protein
MGHRRERWNTRAVWSPTSGWAPASSPVNSRLDSGIWRMNYRLSLERERGRERAPEKVRRKKNIYFNGRKSFNWVFFISFKVV